MATDPLLIGLMQGFVGESTTLAQKATRHLLHLEKADPNDAATANSWEEVNRALHTLKGSAGTLGLDDLSSLAHAMEDLLAPHRVRAGALPPEVIDALLSGLDGFLSRLRAEAEGKTAEDTSALIAELLRRAASAGPDATSTPSGTPDAAPAPAAPQAGPSAAPKTAPAESEFQEGSWRVDARQVLALLTEIDRLREVRLRLDERQREVDRCIAALSKSGGASDLSDTRAALNSVSRALGTDGSEAAAIVETLEDGVKAICTLPIRIVLDPLERTVRDLSRSLGKEARLSVIGGEVSLDRRLLEELRGPLMHLIRNAVDHGLEKPAKREARGKHREGALVVRVEQQGNMVFVEVSDDGEGIDIQRIREVALQRGVVSAEALAALDTHGVQQLIFRPGFSTRDEVTETSGRGVGLDVVRAGVLALRGNVEVQSVPGQGTRFTLSLPSEMGSSPVLVVRCGEHHFGIPTAAIESAVVTRAELLRTSRSAGRIEHREQLIPLVNLGALLGIRHDEWPPVDRPALVVQARGSRQCLWVDEIVGDLELVIRPLPAELRHLSAYQGASTLARGDLLPILRPDWLVGQERVVSDAPAARRVLVVDDSLTARALHRAMLEAGGYSVHAVGRAVHALDLLRAGGYDAIVCDIGMEGMDGIEFTRRVRAEQKLRSVPVVLVSGRDSPDDQMQGLKAGADAFLGKSDCASGRLLAALDSVSSRRRNA